MIAPLGSLSLAEEALRQTLAAAPALRAWLGAADVAAALQRIHYDGLPGAAEVAQGYAADEFSALRPYVYLYTDVFRGFQRHVLAGGDAFWFSDGGRLYAWFEQEIPAHLDDGPGSDIHRVFKNALGQIIDGVCDLAGRAPATPDDPALLALTNVTLEQGPELAIPEDRATRGRAIGALLSFTWGQAR